MDSYYIVRFERIGGGGSWCMLHWLRQRV